MTATVAQQTSGDLIADRRYAFAQDLVARGDLAAAADLFQQAVDAAPQFAAAWFALGETREKLGDHAGAIAAFRRARDLDAEDRLGALLRLIRLGAAPLQEMPAAYVRGLFDQYAARFDPLLTQGLTYRGPEILKAAVVEACRMGHRRFHFAAALDLGCGTGLGGAAFRPFADHLAGVDLSPEMIKQARTKGIYDRLRAADLLAFLETDAAHATYDLVLAADVFVYVADLAPVLRACTKMLAPGGLLAFTVETYPGDAVVLGEKLRYAHSATHVRSAIAAAGFALLSLAEASTRNEAGVPVPGLVVVAQR